MAHLKKQDGANSMFWNVRLQKWWILLHWNCSHEPQRTESQTNHLESLQILDIKSFFKIQQKNSLKSFRFIVIFNFSSCIDGFIKNSGRKFKFECENFKKIISGLNNRSFPLPGFELPTLIKNYNPTLVALLESPMLDDPHLSQQHASLSGSNQGQRQDFEPTEKSDKSSVVDSLMKFVYKIDSSLLENT